MAFWKSTASSLYYVMLAIIVLQFIVLFFRNVGFLALWTLLEYMQLIAFMPLYNFKLIPYLYDAFKPMLISHLILFNNSFFFSDMDTDFFNVNYKYYNLPVSQLIQCLINIVILIAVVALLNLAILCLSACCSSSKFGGFLSSRLGQFKFNAYIRLYMLAYFDFTFFSILKIIEGDNSTSARKAALFVSYGIFVVSIVAPVFFVAILLRRYDVLKVKEAKAKFNSLVLKIDKNSKWRVVNIAFFFGRRLVTGNILWIILS